MGETQFIRKGDVKMERLELEISRSTPSLQLDLDSQNSPLSLKIENRSDEGGTTNYNRLSNKPSIEGVVLQGDKTFPQLGLNTLSVQDIEKILYLD